MRLARGVLRCAPKWRTQLTRKGRIRRMNLLAIETSTEAGSIALCRNGDLVRRACPAGVPHSATLLPLIRNTLGDLGLSLGKLDGIAFAAGPGSFTGLRVACGVAQGLAVAYDLPVIAVGTLAALAAASGGERVLVALDARMGEVYFAAFVAGQPVTSTVVAPADKIELPAGRGWLACGNGLVAHPPLRARLAPIVDVWQPELIPDAGAVARLALAALARGEGVDAADAVPVYVRNKVAMTVAERLAAGGRA